MEKECTKCHKIQNFSNFYKGKDKYKLTYYCKKCCNENNKKNCLKWYAKNGTEYYKNYVYDRRPLYKKWRESEKGKIYMKNYYKTDYYKKISKAKDILNIFLRKYKIRKRNTCEICHTSPTQCHHEDYTKPLEYIELCKRCHEFLHMQYKRQNIKI